MIRKGTFVDAAASLIVVEEEAFVRAQMERALEREGFVVWGTADRRSARDRMLEPEGTVDLVVWPWDADTRERTEWLRTASHGIPVLFTAQVWEDGDALRRVEQNRAAVLWKPFTPYALARKVRGLLRTP